MGPLDARDPDTFTITAVHPAAVDPDRVLSAVDDIRHGVRRGRVVLSEITDDHLGVTQSVAPAIAAQGP